MSDLSNNVAILSYLKDKVHKWKNISILLTVILVAFMTKVLLGEKFTSKIESSQYIAKIKIEGEISLDDYRDKVLKEVAKNDSVKAAIISINSPGGGIVSSEILFLQLREIAKKKPLIVTMKSVAASGGYMAAIASDHIIAHNGTLTGSIGVLMQSAELVDLAQKIGIKFKTYKSAPLKASPSPFERTSQLTKRVIRESIKDSANFFFDLVKERRAKKLKKTAFGKIFDGRVFTGRQALRVGLIDEIGGEAEALKYLKEKHKIDVEETPLRDVKIVNARDKILKKFSSILPFFPQSKQLSGQEIMAITP